MRKIRYALTGLFLLIALNTVKAQTNSECIKRYNFFKGDYQTRRYQDAKEQLLWLMDNCPKLSLSVYKYGDRLARILKDNDLVKKVYNQRLQNFPNKDVARAYSDYATFLSRHKLASDTEIFSLLEKAYKADPVKMGVVNIYKYFKGITDRNKDTDPQKVFDTYDDVMEAVQKKIAYYNKKIAKLRKEATNSGQGDKTTVKVQEKSIEVSVDSNQGDKKNSDTNTFNINALDSKDQRIFKAYTINTKALGQVEDGLNNIISTIATCPRLVVLYKKGFEANKDNAQWLRRAVSRLYNKQCQSDPLYEKLARAYAEVSKSANAYSFLAGILEEKGNVPAATQMRKKAFDLETDPNKKALYKLQFAQNAAKHKGKTIARRLAREALQYNPNLGRAYLFIASLYARSANSCGTNEFEKRMVYVAALNKARKAVEVDPSISRKAAVYIRSYRANIPSKKIIFQQGIASGTPYKIKCWIGETVRVP